VAENLLLILSNPSLQDPRMTSLQDLKDPSNPCQNCSFGPELHSMTILETRPGFVSKWPIHTITNRWRDNYLILTNTVTLASWKKLNKMEFAPNVLSTRTFSWISIERKDLRGQMEQNSSTAIQKSKVSLA
jgi:hypothetical protein